MTATLERTKLQASFSNTLDTAEAGLAALRPILAGPALDDLTNAVEIMLAARGRVIVTGMGKSGHIGLKIAATLASTGTPATFVHPAEASHGDLGMITRDDAILALSWSGETVELASILQYSRRFRVPLIALTGNRASALGRSADAVIELPAVKEACPHGLAPTTSTLLQLTIGDCIAIALLEARGFSALDFKVFHPGGSLGGRLRLVGDLMHKGDALPIAGEGEIMSQALVTMTAKGFGCLGVTDADGKFIGIITDGDLRRHMGDDLLKSTVSDIMTRSAKAIEPTALAASALEMMNSQRITAVFVIEHGRPVGIVHMHDLLRAGIA